MGKIGKRLQHRDGRCEPGITSNGGQAKRSATKAATDVIAEAVDGPDAVWLSGTSPMRMSITMLVKMLTTCLKRDRRHLLSQ